jgi:hypothetical protein
MNYAIRPIVIGGRGGDTYVGYVPTDINKTATVTSGNLYVKGKITSTGASIFGQLNVNNNSNMDDFARIQLSNYGTYIYTEYLPEYDAHRYKFFLRNVNNFEMNYVYYNNTGNFISKFGFTTNGNIGDFAEMFEWEDGNPENEKRVGYTVLVNEQGFIRKATMDDNSNDVIGVVSATATVTGSAAGMEYNKKYLKDDFEQTILDASGNPMINPDYDESIPYENREKRKEWSPIGLYGKLIVRNGSPINPKWRLIGTRQTAKIYLA